VGWNEEGVPTSEILQKLDLKDVELKLKKRGFVIIFGILTIIN